MQHLYVLRDPVPNYYHIVGIFTEVGKQKIRSLTGIKSVTKMSGDSGIYVTTDGKISFSDLFQQIKILAEAS